MRFKTKLKLSFQKRKKEKEKNGQTNVDVHPKCDHDKKKYFAKTFEYFDF